MSKKITTSFRLGGVQVDVTTEDELSIEHGRSVHMALHIGRSNEKPVTLGFTQEDADTLIAALQTGRRRKRR